MRNKGQRGFALLLVFAMMSAAAVVIYLQLPRFVMQAQRAKEQLLIDRGEQYQRAIQLYYRKVKSWPQSIEDLEKGNNTRYLRRRYVDPFTGKADWRLVHVNNGIYTDSLVYNQKDPTKPKAQTFVAEMASIGTNGAAGEEETPNAAMKVRGSDAAAPSGTEAPDPIDSLPEALRAFVYRGSIRPAGSAAPKRPVDEEDVQYAKGTSAPTAGIYGVGTVDLRGLTGAQVMAGNSSGFEAGSNASTPTPGAGGISYEELQRRLLQEAAAGPRNVPPSAGPGSFIGGGQAIGTPYTPPVTPGANGLSYAAIVGNDPSNPIFGQPSANYPPVPGTAPGFPTGINPPAPPFRPAPSTGGGGGFIGGPAQGNFPVTGPGQAGGFSNPGGGQQLRGFGPTPGVAAPSGSAQQQLNDAIFGPRPPGSAGPATGTAAGGSGLAGVASKYRGTAVKVYREQSRFQMWEFIYDPAKDTAGRQGGQAGAQLPGAPLQGGLPPGTAQQPPGFNGQQPGSQGPNQGRGTGAGGFGSTVGGGGFGNSPSGGGSSFIGGPVTAPTAAPPPAPSGAPGTNGQPRPPGQPIPVPVQTPPTQGGGGFIK